MGDKVEIVGILNGYDGLINGNYREMSPDEFSGILTVAAPSWATKRTPFKKMRVVEDDKVDKVAAMKKNYRAAKLDCLLCLGGNGTPQNCQSAEPGRAQHHRPAQNHRTTTSTAPM